MARGKNQIVTEILRVSTSRQVVAYLKDLTQTGLWGKNPAEAAGTLVAESIRRLIADGTLMKRKIK